MSYVAESNVNGAKRDLNYHEGSNNWNRYSLWQYGAPNNPWCLSACCYWANVDGGFQFWQECTFHEKGESYTPTMMQRAKARGVWRDKWWRAAPGDLVEFDWGNNGLIDHVETVIYDDGTTIITIGGNTSDGVYYRRRDRTYVAGFIALSEAGQTAVVVVPPPPPKVRPQYMPANPLVARLQHHTGGWFDAYQGGRVEFLSPNFGAAPRQVGIVSAADRAKWEHNAPPGGRKVSRIISRWYILNDGKPDEKHIEGFELVAEDGFHMHPSDQD